MFKFLKIEDTFYHKTGYWLEDRWPLQRFVSLPIGINQIIGPTLEEYHVLLVTITK